MGFSQIGHVDIIPDAGAVRGGVIGTENAQIRPFPCSRPDTEGNKVRGVFTGLPDLSLRVGTRHVKITQGDVLQVPCVMFVLQDFFHHHLALPVRINRIKGGLLRSGHFFRDTVHRRGRGKNELAHPGLLHSPEQTQTSLDIVDVILQRLGHRLRHHCKGGKVHHRIRPEFKQYLQKLLPIQQIPLDQITKEHRLGIAGNHIIVGKHIKALFPQGF